MKSSIVLIFALFSVALGKNLVTPYIALGEKAKRGSYPYFASLQRGYHGCGGSVLNNRWVLTARHCVNYDDPSKMKELKIVVGIISLNEEGDTYEVSKLTLHPSSDVGLVQAKTKIKFSKYIQPIQLNSNFIQGGILVTAVGFGVREEGSGTLSESLMFVNMITLGDCEKDVVCAGPWSIGPRCGDSGGPLVYKNTLIGITQGRISDKNDNFVNSFVRISSFVKWIKKQIELN